MAKYAFSIPTVIFLFSYYHITGSFLATCIVFLCMHVWNPFNSTPLSEGTAKPTSLFSFFRRTPSVDCQRHITRFERAAYSSRRMKDDYLHYCRSFDLDFGDQNSILRVEDLKKVRAALTDVERAKDLYVFEVDVRRQIQEDILQDGLKRRQGTYVLYRRYILELLDAGVREYETKFPESLKAVKAQVESKPAPVSAPENDGLIGTLDSIKDLVVIYRGLSAMMGSSVKKAKKKQTTQEESSSA